MNQKRHNITFEMLSAYLDNQLSEKDRSKVESALQMDPALKHDFQMLDATRHLLRNAPRLKVPRNFTLTPAMVAKQNPFKFWMPAMSFSSALAAVLFVLSFVFNINMVGGPMIAQTRNMDHANTLDTITLENIEMADESTKSTVEETPMIIQWFGQQANGMGGGGPAGAVAEGQAMAEEAAPMMLDEPSNTMEMEADTELYALEEPAPAGEAVAGQMPAEEPVEAIQESDAVEEMPVPKEGPFIAGDDGADLMNQDASNLILGVSPEEDRGQIIEEPQQVMPQIYAEEIPPSNQNPILLIVLRSGLALLAITFAIIAYLMHRQRT
jgi:hypothetical protein